MHTHTRTHTHDCNSLQEHLILVDVSNFWSRRREGQEDRERQERERQERSMSRGSRGEERA